MAKLKNLDAFSVPNTDKAVGHNRRAKTDEHGFTSCFLHGHEIVKLDRWRRTLHIDPCGWPTVTTQAAIKDFTEALGFTVRVSFAQRGAGYRIRKISGKYLDVPADAGDPMSFATMGLWEHKNHER